MLVRKAVPADIPAVTAIYEALLDREERGELSTGWTRGVYPTEQTALDALAAGTLYVLEDGGRVAAAAKLDQNQMAQYSQCTWRHDAPPEQVLVLHTLVVDPTVKGKGYGTAFVAFYEQLARETDRPYLRIDTNARNTPARALYKKLGYTEAGIVAGTFNGIPNVQLVCLEKKVYNKGQGGAGDGIDPCKRERLPGAGPGKQRHSAGGFLGQLVRPLPYAGPRAGTAGR